MLGNLTYRNPTRVHFGPDALEQLAGELAQSGPTVMLAYGGGSVIDYAKGVPVPMTPPTTSASSTSPTRTTTRATTWPRAS